MSQTEHPYSTGAGSQQARDVAHEATDRTRGLVDTRADLGDQAASQQQYLASGLRSLGNELGRWPTGPRTRVS